MTARQVRPRTRALALCGAVGLSLALTGCGGSSDDTKPPTTLPAASSAAPDPSASPADPDAAVKAAVLASYSSMSAEQMKAYRQGSARDTKVEEYASLDALTQIRTDLDRLKESRTVVRGDVGHDAEVTGLDLEAQTPTATLSDCVDLSKYQTYDTVARKVIPLPPDQPLRYVMTVTAEQWDSGWMITRITPEDGPEC